MSKKFKFAFVCLPLLFSCNKPENNIMVAYRMHENMISFSTDYCDFTISNNIEMQRFEMYIIDKSGQPFSTDFTLYTSLPKKRVDSVAIDCFSDNVNCVLSDQNTISYVLPNEDLCYFSYSGFESETTKSIRDGLFELVLSPYLVVFGWE